MSFVLLKNGVRLDLPAEVESRRFAAAWCEGVWAYEQSRSCPYPGTTPISRAFARWWAKGWNAASAAYNPELSDTDAGFRQFFIALGKTGHFGPEGR